MWLCRGGVQGVQGIQGGSWADPGSVSLVWAQVWGFTEGSDVEAEVVRCAGGVSAARSASRTGCPDPLAGSQSKYPDVYKCGVRFTFQCSCQNLADWVAH